MTEENNNDIKGSNIMFMRGQMKKQRNALMIATRQRKLMENKRRIIIRLDIEAQTTNNAYTENEQMIMVGRLDDSELNSNDRDVRAFFNHNCTPMSESNLFESNDEFDRRQYKLLQVLKRKNNAEDKKYA